MAIKRTNLIEYIQNNKLQITVGGFLAGVVALFLLIVIFMFICSFSIGQVCYDADDFGFPKIDVSSKSEPIEGPEDSTQTATWKSSSLQATGGRVAIKVHNRDLTVGDQNELQAGWRPWGFKIYSPHKCDYETAKCNDPKTDGCVDAPITNPFCYLDKGIGLYALVTDPNTPNGEDPNLNADFKRNPVTLINALTFHLGEGAINRSSGKIGSPHFFDPSAQIGGFVGDLPDNQGRNGTPGKDYEGGNLFFNILDRHYVNNHEAYNGILPPDLGYHVIVKSGFTEPGGGFFARLIKFVQETLVGAAKHVFEGIVKNTGFNDYIRILLIIHVTLFGLGYLAGFVDMTKSEVIIRVIKIGTVTAFMSDGSWDFFHNHLFQIFTGGVETILGVMFVNFFGSSTSGHDLLDSILRMFFASETHFKLWSLVTTGNFIFGFMFVVIFYISLFFFLMACLSAVILYCISFIAIAILIILGPIFIPFILFKVTKPMTEQWLKQLISYFMQPLLVMAFIGFMSLIALNQIQGMIGYEVCNKILFEWKSSIPGADLRPLSFKIRFFRPNLKPSDFDPSKLADIRVPTMVKLSSLTPRNASLNSHMTQQNVNLSQYNTSMLRNSFKPEIICQPYECFDERFPAAPFLQPQKIINGKMQMRDQLRIDELKEGTFVSFPSAIGLGLILILTFNFTAMVPIIARGLAGVQMSLAQADTAAHNALDGLKDMALGSLSIASRFATVIRTGTDTDYVNEVSRNLKQIKYAYQDNVGSVTDLAKIPGKAISILAANHPRVALGLGIGVGIIFPPSLLFMGTASLYSKYSRLKRSFREYEQLGSSWRHNKMDRIGATFDNFQMYQEHLKYITSLGLTGTSMNEDGVLIDRYGEKTGMRDVNGNFVTRSTIAANQFANVYSNLDDPIHRQPNSSVTKDRIERVELRDRYGATFYRSEDIVEETFTIRRNDAGNEMHHIVTSQETINSHQEFMSSLKTTSRGIQMSLAIGIASPVLGVMVASGTGAYLAYKGVKAARTMLKSRRDIA